MKCPNCGHDYERTKLTLNVSKDLIKQARDAKINLSQFMESCLRMKLSGKKKK